MSSVAYSDPYNSTLFTTCCKVAILAQGRYCPMCSQDVFPFFKGMTDKEAREYEGFYNNRAELARHSAARQRGYIG